ncbi:murein-DD-endopeptidase [Corticibacter populi]|nr:murein-DD-endopeptidase [Corticibacter populi]
MPRSVLCTFFMMLLWMLLAPQALAYAPNAQGGAAPALRQALQTLALHSNAALLLDAESGEVLFAKDERHARPIASITKLMTALLISESRLDMQAVITITDADVDRIKRSSSRLPVGTRLSRRELLQLTLMSSENRAAHALARTHPQGLKRFVEMMNARAMLLGMTSTRFADPTGLSDANRSNAHDLALLVAATRSDSMISVMSVTPQHDIRLASRQLHYVNSNALVRYAEDMTIALQKTGYIREAGYCLVMQINVDGHTYTLVLLNANSAKGRLADARHIHARLAAHVPAPADPIYQQWLQWQAASVDAGTGE